MEEKRGETTGLQEPMPAYFLCQRLPARQPEKGAFDRLESVAERNKEMPFEEVGSDIAEAIAENP